MENRHLAHSQQKKGEKIDASLARTFDSGSATYRHYLFLRDKYDPVIKAAKEGWMLSTD
jgi:hypothetical protein